MEIWSLILQSNTFNFVIMVILLAVIFKFAKIKEKLEHGCKQIEETIEASQKSKETSAQELLKAQAALENVNDEISDIIDLNNKNIELLKGKIDNETLFELQNIEQNTKKIIDSENKQTLSRLSEKTAKIAIEIAKNHIKQVLKNKPEYHQKFIDDSILELNNGLK